MPAWNAADPGHCLQWIDRYPDARSYACPGLQQRTDVPYTTGEPFS